MLQIGLCLVLRRFANIFLPSSTRSRRVNFLPILQFPQSHQEQRMVFQEPAKGDKWSVLESNNLPEEDKCVNCRSFTWKISSDILIKNRSLQALQKRKEQKEVHWEGLGKKIKLMDEKWLNAVPECFAEVGLHTTIVFFKPGSKRFIDIWRICKLHKVFCMQYLHSCPVFLFYSSNLANKSLHMFFWFFKNLLLFSEFLLELCLQGVFSR